MEFPAFIADRILKICIDSRSPAFLLINEQGVLTELGGELEVYGLSDLKKGEPALERVFVLQGILPCSDSYLFLPFVKGELGRAADIHIFFEEKKGNYVLFLDATLEMYQHRLLQQKGNELSLLREREARLLGLFARLDILVLARIGDKTFEAIGPIPLWALRLLPDIETKRSSIVIPGERFLFLEHFSADAEKTWESRSEEPLRSGPWIETDDNGNELFLEATAVTLDNREILLIQYLRFDYQNKQSLIQTARENSLKFERISKTENALRLSEEKNRALLQAMPDWWLRIGKDDVLIEFKAGKGYRHQSAVAEMAGRKIQEIFPPDVAREILRCVERTKQTDEVQICEFPLMWGDHLRDFECRVVSTGESEALAILRERIP
jgi:PAS domain-containing protein